MEEWVSEELEMLRLKKIKRDSSSKRTTTSTRNGEIRGHGKGMREVLATVPGALIAYILRRAAQTHV
jgi:hypothetical protein